MKITLPPLHATQAVKGLRTFFSSAAAFQEAGPHACSADSTGNTGSTGSTGSTDSTTSAIGPAWLCPGQLLTAAAGGSCSVLSVQDAGGIGDMAGTGEEAGMGSEGVCWLLEVGCDVTVVTPGTLGNPSGSISGTSSSGNPSNDQASSSQPTTAQQEGQRQQQPRPRGRSTHEKARLALSNDPHAPVPAFTLGALLQRHLREQGPTASSQHLTLLHVACGGTCAWEVVNQLHVQVGHGRGLHVSHGCALHAHGMPPPAGLHGGWTSRRMASGVLPCLFHACTPWVPRLPSP